MSVTFSEELIKEYRYEIRTSYGVLVSEEEAQIQLRSLTQCLFPTAIGEEKSGSRELLQGKAQPACSSSLSDRLSNGGGNEVGLSITPTSGHRDIKTNYE